MTDEIMEDMLTWRHCAECEGPCDPKHRAEYSLFKKTDGGTFAIHKWCIEPWMEAQRKRSAIKANGS